MTYQYDMLMTLFVLYVNLPFGRSQSNYQSDVALSAPNCSGLTSVNGCVGACATASGCEIIIMPPAFHLISLGVKYRVNT